MMSDGSVGIWVGRRLAHSSGRLPAEEVLKTLWGTMSETFEKIPRKNEWDKVEIGHDHEHAIP